MGVEPAHRPPDRHLGNLAVYGLRKTQVAVQHPFAVTWRPMGRASGAGA